MTWLLNAVRGIRITLSIVVMMVIATSEATGQCGETKLLASDGAVADSFGNSVSISGDIAIVGARWDDDNGRSSGSAYIYRFNPDSSGWVEEAKLLASDGSESDFFGWPVSISGAPGFPGSEFAIVGSRGNDDNGDNSGSAYIYRLNHDKSGWIEEAKLLASDPEANDQFGMAVSISGTPGTPGIPGTAVAIVGAWFDDDNGTSSGSAYIYRFNPVTSEWIEEAKLLASDGMEFNYFGSFVSISGNVVIVGTSGYNENDFASGSAYIYRFNPDTSGWVEEAKLLASGGAEHDHFGYSVSISGTPGHEVAIVGADTDDDNGTESGSAYIYRFNSNTSEWVEEAKLLASDGSGGDRFGWPVSISSAPGIPGNKVVIVGAMGNDDNGMISGSAYIFRFNPDTSEWTEEAKLLAPDAAALDAFGSFVAVSDDVAIVGAYGNDDYGSLSGSAYIFDLSRLGACPVDTDCDGMVGVTELLGLLSAWGVCVPSCPFDFDGNYGVDVLDLLTLIGAWGPCP